MQYTVGEIAYLPTLKFVCEVATFSLACLHTEIKSEYCLDNQVAKSTFPKINLEGEKKQKKTLI